MSNELKPGGVTAADYEEYAPGCFRITPEARARHKAAIKASGLVTRENVLDNVVSAKELKEEGWLFDSAREDWRAPLPIPVAEVAAPSVQKFRRETATYHDPEHPGRDIHGVDHWATQGIVDIRVETKSGSDLCVVSLVMRRPISATELMTLQDHLRSWHPCVGFADGK